MKPRTEAQKLASRLNGARSKGPVTPEGKARVSLNAVTHGLHAINPVLQAEDPEEWQLFLNDHIQQWQPDSLPEWDLVVNDLAGTKWRLRRLISTENALMDLETERVQDSIRQACASPDAALLIAAAWESLQSSGNVALDRLHRHETRLHRIIAKAQAQLEAMKAARQQQSYESADTAVEPEAATLSPSPKVDVLANEPERPARPATGPMLVVRPWEPGLENKPGPAATIAAETSRINPVRCPKLATTEDKEAA